MNDADSSTDPTWRAEMLAELSSGDIVRATDALLSLTNHEGNRALMESLLLEVLDGVWDIQVKQLAVICMGHLARIHGSISEAVVARLKVLRDDVSFGSRARNALGDVEMFTGG